MYLLSVALAASSVLGNVASQAIKVAGSGRVMLEPVKGLLRAMQKAQEDYAGDYTRLTDLMRCTLVFEKTATLVKALNWLLGEGGKLAGFEGCRAKDRLSLRFDAEMSGGNRDVLINGWLTVPHRGEMRRLVIEVQLHLEPLLLALKHDLHVLYDGARVLGAA